jgi:biopolymer transport protein ExbD
MEIPSLRARRRARIEIIPLIDVMFFLLATFVMVSLSMVQPRGITVNLPGAATAAPLQAAGYAVVTVDDAGGLRFEREPVDLAGLVVRLRAFAEGRSDPRVLVQGDAGAHLGAVLRVLDESRRLGITHVTIETRLER